LIIGDFPNGWIFFISAGASMSLPLLNTSIL
jgi:hypothetical protein